MSDETGKLAREGSGPKAVAGGKWLRSAGGWAAAIVLVAGLIVSSWVAFEKRGSSGDSRFAPKQWVDLKEPKGAAAAPALQVARPPSLRVAIAPVISPEKSAEIYRDFVKYLAEKVNRQPVFLQRSTYSEVNELVRYNRCDIALVCTYAFVRAEHEFGMEALVVPQVKGETTYHSLILVPSKAPITSLPGLRGKRFASADVMSNTGWIYPALWLREHGEDPEKFFSEHQITGSHDRSVKAVLEGYVDGAAVDSLVYDEMVREDATIAVRTRVVLRSPPFGIPPFVVNPRIDPELRRELQAALTQMDHDAGGNRILTSLRIDRFVVPARTLFDSVREASRAWESR